MIRIAITAAAYDAIADTLPFGSDGYEPKRSAFIWLETGRSLASTRCASRERVTARSSFASQRRRQGRAATYVTPRIQPPAAPRYSSTPI
jgi:hypothetical protein